MLTQLLRRLTGGGAPREVIVHIGLEKTGTTSIQKTLRANAANLAQFGVHFDTHFASTAPGASGNSVGLVLAAQAAERRCWRSHSIWPVRHNFDDYRYAGLLAPNKVQRIIFSAEHLSSELTEPEEIARLGKFCRTLGRRVTIIAYVRRPDQFVHSVTNEYIKAGGVFRLSQQDDVLKKIIAGGKVNFSRTLLNYVHEFGSDNVIIKRFDRRFLYRGDVVDDFFSTFGLSKALKIRRRPANTSLSREALYIYSMLTEISRDLNDPPEIAAAHRALIKNGKGRADFLTRSEAVELAAVLSDEKAALEQATGVKLYGHDYTKLPEARPPIQSAEIRRLSNLPEVALVLKMYRSLGQSSAI